MCCGEGQAPKKKEFEFIEKNEMEPTKKMEYSGLPLIVIDDPVLLETKAEREARLERSKEFLGRLADAYKVTKESSTLNFSSNNWFDETLKKRVKDPSAPIILIKSRMCEDN